MHVDIVPIIVIIGAVGIIAGATIFHIGRYMAKNKLRLQVSIPEQTMRMGQMLNASLKINPKKTVTVSQIRIIVDCKECIRTERLHDCHCRDENNGHHDRSTSNTEKVIAKSEILLPGTDFQAGKKIAINIAIKIPEDGIPTGKAGNYKNSHHLNKSGSIKWFLSVFFEIPSSFDAIHKQEIRVTG